MKLMFPSIISGLALAAVITLITRTSTFAQSAQTEQGIEGVWDVSVTIVQCNTGQAVGTGHAILMFSDGGSLTQISTNSLFSAGLGTWRHLRGQDYTAVDTAVDRFFEFGADGSFAGTSVITRDIELSSNADEYTAPSISEFYNPAGQLVSTTCSTTAATRLDRKSD
jgi:hypothetical protein